MNAPQRHSSWWLFWHATSYIAWISSNCFESFFSSQQLRGVITTRSNRMKFRLLLITILRTRYFSQKQKNKNNKTVKKCSRTNYITTILQLKCVNNPAFLLRGTAITATHQIFFRPTPGSMRIRRNLISSKSSLLFLLGTENLPKSVTSCTEYLPILCSQQKWANLKPACYLT